MPLRILHGLTVPRAARGWIVAAVILILLTIVLRLTVLGPPVVSIAEVTRGNLADEVEGTGTVNADVVADIASKITGRIEGVSVDEGDFVQKDEIVATLDQTDLRQQLEVAQARLAAAKATAAERRREWLREMDLVKTGAASVEDSQQYTERLAVAESAVRAARAESGAAEYNLSLTQIPSLFGGVVTKRWVVPGTSVVPGQAMFTVADTELIYVNAYIDQNFTGRLKRGQAATVILRGREGKPLSASVLRISPQADAATEETVAEVAFTIPRDEFELGQWANVFVRVGEANGALLIPGAAVMRMDGKAFVFVVDRDNVVHRQRVRIVAQSPRLPRIAVAGPLRPRDRVVLMPMGLAAGARVRPRQVNRAPVEEGAAQTETDAQSAGQMPIEAGGVSPTAMAEAALGRTQP